MHRPGWITALAGQPAGILAALACGPLVRVLFAPSSKIPALWTGGWGGGPSPTPSFSGQRVTLTITSNEEDEPCITTFRQASRAPGRRSLLILDMVRPSSGRFATTLAAGEMMTEALKTNAARDTKESPGKARAKTAKCLLRDSILALENSDLVSPDIQADIREARHLYERTRFRRRRGQRAGNGPS